MRHCAVQVQVDCDCVDGRTSDPKTVFQAVISHGCNQWHAIGLELGFCPEEVDDIANGVSNSADKISALFHKKIDVVGQSDATKALLEACRWIPYPIIDSVMDILSK